MSGTSTCFSESSVTVCYAPNSKGRGLHTSDTFLPPIEETTASIIRPAAHRFIVCAAIFNALSGREDCSLRARRHTYIPPLRRRQLHYGSTHEATSGAVNLSGAERVSRLRRHPFARGRCAALHWRLNALPHTPEQVRPASLPFVSLPSTASSSPPFRDEQCRHNALRTFDNTAAPGPDVRTAEVLTTLRPSVNRYTYSE